MILITGAAGKTGRSILRALAGREVTVRALVRRPEQSGSVRQAGAAEVVVGDLRNPADVKRAARGAEAVYHICPNVSPDETSIGRTVIAACHRQGVGRLVYHSVLHPQTEAMPHHWQKLRVEELLLASGLGFIILQPAAYMQNLLGQWESIVGRGIYSVPYAAATRLGMVDLEDVAEAAARVLTGEGHDGATYELCGSEPLTQDEVAAVLGAALGREVEVEVVPRDLWRARARASGLGDYQVETLAAMFAYYERHGFWGSTRVLSWLLGRPPTSLARFAARTAATRSLDSPGPRAAP